MVKATRGDVARLGCSARRRRPKTPGRRRRDRRGGRRPGGAHRDQAAAGPSTSSRRSALSLRYRANADGLLYTDTICVKMGRMSATAVELHPPTTWTDPKRYAWLLGLLVPLLPLMAWGLVEATGLGVFWCWGPMFLFVSCRCSTPRSARTRRTRRTASLKWLEQDRYYRWCTYAFLPLQYGALLVGCWLLGDRRPLRRRVARARAHASACVSGIAINTAHELGHKRASARALAVEGRARARPATATSSSSTTAATTSASPRPRIPASSRMGESFYRFWPRTVRGSLRSAWELEAERLAASASARWTLQNDILNAWAMTVVLFARADRRLRPRRRCRACSSRPCSASRCSRSSTTSSTTACCATSATTAPTLRAHAPRALVELRQRLLQRPALPPAAPLRPPRQPDPPLPGAAALRRGARAAVGLRDDDRPRARPAAVAARDGPARASRTTAAT